MWSFMIHFRCWYCHKRISRTEQQIGQRFTCSCRYPVRVPKRSGGNSRVKTAVDWLVETVVYGGGGGLLGFCLAAVLIGQTRFLMPGWLRWRLLAGLTLFGFLFGLFGGERGINIVGRLIRERENR
jgi:hypothetical protein